MLDLSRRAAFNEDHDAFRDQVRRFFDRELTPISTAGRSRARSTSRSGARPEKRGCSARLFRKPMAGSASIMATTR